MIQLTMAYMFEEKRKEKKKLLKIKLNELDRNERRERKKKAGKFTSEDNTGKAICSSILKYIQVSERES